MTSPIFPPSSGLARYLDGYEAAAATGAGIKDTRYGNNPPATIEGGTGQACAFVRARPGDANAPIVIHLVEYGGAPKPFTLRLRTAAFGDRPLIARLRLPVAYDAEQHRKAQETGDFSRSYLKRRWLHQPIAPSPHYRFPRFAHGAC